MSLTRASFLSPKIVTVQPGAQVRVNITGTFVVCLEASNEFYLGFDDDSELSPFNKGLSYELDPGDVFHAVILENRGTGANTVKLLIGRGKVEDRRLNIVSGLTLNVVNQDSPTLALMQRVNIAAGAATAILPGNRNGAGGAFRRKVLHITNNDAALELELRNPTSFPVGGALSIFPKTTAVVFNDSDYTIFNPNGAAISCGILETFYAS
jgi:hypothetical protein